MSLVNKILLVLLLMMFSNYSSGQTMNIGLFHKYKLSRISFGFERESYEVYADSIYIGEINETDRLEVLLAGKKKLSVKFNGILKGEFSKVYIDAVNKNGALELRPLSPQLKTRKYEDDFEISVVKGKMTVVNQVSMTDYLSGVVESEGGGGRHSEYYKVQALMSRTYALKIRKRHQKEGFELCDDVHCQAYHHMLRYTPAIREAVEFCDKQVLMDSSDNLVEAYFSANCGGQVCDASHVWNESVPYVKSFLDTFCVHTRQAEWKKEIDKWKWRNFLVQQYGLPTNDSTLNHLMYNFSPTERVAFYIHPSLGVPMRDLRKKFRLKSSYFSTRLKGDKVVLEGRGYGHGVGLCQEGAMKMARLGYSYVQIALYYFNGLRVVEID